MTTPLITWDWLRTEHSDADVIALKRILSSIANLPKTKDIILMDKVGITPDGLTVASAVAMNHYYKPYPDDLENRVSPGMVPRLAVEIKAMEERIFSGPEKPRLGARQGVGP